MSHATPRRETRLVNYVSPEAIAGLDSWPVFKFFEQSRFNPECYQSAFRREGKVEFMVDSITLDPSDRGFSCFQVEVTARRLLLGMKKNTDRLVLFECEGFCLGPPPLEHPRGTGLISVLVEAIRLIRPICTYDKLREERR